MSKAVEAAKRKVAEREEQKSKQEGSGINVIDWDAPKNYRRFLPMINEDGKLAEEWYIEVPQHPIGEDGKPVRCNDPTGKAADDCAGCIEFNRRREIINKKYPKKSQEGKEAYFKMKDRYGRKVRYFALGIDTHSEESEVGAIIMGEMIFSSLLEQMVDEELCGDFTHPKTGRTMMVKKKGTDRATRYSAHPTSDIEALPDWDDLKAAIKDDLMPKLHALIDIFVPKYSNKRLTRMLEA